MDLEGWHSLENKKIYVAILTRENMRKRKWPGTPLCSFCGSVETSNHLLFQCSIDKIVWGALGKVLGTSCCPKNVWQSFVCFIRSCLAVHVFI
jgi:hypothetical protein